MTDLEAVLSAMYGANVTPNEQVRGLMEVALPIVRRLLIEGMREWSKNKEAHSDYEGYQLLEFGELIDAYAKEKGID